MGFGGKNDDERDRWCVPNGMDWSINPVPESGNPDGEDRLIIVLKSDGGPRVVGPTTHYGFVSIAGLEAITRLGRFKVNLVVQYSHTALEIVETLQRAIRAVDEQEELHRRWRDEDSSDSSVAAGGGVLDREEIVALLDARPKPDWIRGLSANAQRLGALIDAAVEGRKWAIPYVFPDGSGYQGPAVWFHLDHWQAVLGGSRQEVEMAANSLYAASVAGGLVGDVGWYFDT